MLSGTCRLITYGYFMSRKEVIKYLCTSILLKATSILYYERPFLVQSSFTLKLCDPPYPQDSRSKTRKSAFINNNEVGCNTSFCTTFIYHFILFIMPCDGKMSPVIRPKQNICLFKLSCQNKIGSVGRKLFFYFIFLFFLVIEGLRGVLVLN